MQLAYFDESGTDGENGATLIAGVVANLADWPYVVRLWKAHLANVGVPYFHYADCKNQRGSYKGWDWQKDCLPHLKALSLIITGNAVGGISAVYLGDWKKGVAARPDLQIRFPSAYSFCFEMMIEKIRREMNDRAQSAIELIFSKHPQYQSRANEIWQWHGERNLWPEISNVRYAEPRDVVGLQMADMLAYETRRMIHKGGDDWRTLPLIPRLAQKHADTGTTLYEIAYAEGGLENVSTLAS